METESSADPPTPTVWPRDLRLRMLLWNFLPLFHICGVIACAWYVSISLAIGGLYLIPPLLCRVILKFSPLHESSYQIGSHEFITWWATAQTQMIFCRLPMLEELLRLVPGLYSMWLRLWGAKIGKLTFWAPGVRILDRSFLQVGDDVVTGAGVRLNAHVIECVEGETKLHLAEIVIGNRCNIGGYSLLTAGCRVNDGEALHAFALLPPFSQWSKGRRRKIAVAREPTN